MSLQESEPIITGPMIAQAVTSHKLQLLLRESLPKKKKFMASKISSSSEVLLLK